MTEPVPQPQPVTNAASWAAAVTAVVGAVLAVLSALHVITPADQDALAPTLSIAVTTAVGAVSAILAALHARRQVTPVLRPRDGSGRPLVVDPAVYGQHAAPVDDLDDWPAAIAREPAPAAYLKRIPEDVVEGKRLGRHVHHDPRSLAYLVEPSGVVATKVWDRKIQVLDQGNLGSCTGNAATGVLGSEPFYSSLTAAQQKTLNEGEAVQLYALATALDGYPGTYPPEDTGSDGLSVAKAAQKSGFISAYKHITSIDAAKTAIQSGPFIVGTDWMSGMDTPDADGLVHATGTVRGGHEYECIGYHADTDLFEFVNSWGESWGKAGHFFYSAADFAKLLARQGDATVFVPVAPSPQPAPPTPAPGPAPAPVPPDVTAWADRTLTRQWSSHEDKKAAHDFLDWQKGTLS